MLLHSISLLMSVLGSTSDVVRGGDVSRKFCNVVFLSREVLWPHIQIAVCLSRAGRAIVLQINHVR